MDDSSQLTSCSFDEQGSLILLGDASERVRSLRAYLCSRNQPTIERRTSISSKSGDEPWNIGPDDLDSYPDEFEIIDNPWDMYDGDEAYLEADIPESRPGRNRERQPPRWFQACRALMSFVDNDVAAEEARKLSNLGTEGAWDSVSRPDEGSPFNNQIRLAAKQRDRVEEFDLLGASTLVLQMYKCARGIEKKSHCGSYWCPRCSARFGSRALYDLNSLLISRYGGDETRIRERVFALTVLGDIIVPMPDVVHVDGGVAGADFDATAVARPLIDLRRRTQRWQQKELRELTIFLARKNLPLEIVAGDRDRSIVRPENLTADVEYLLQLNEDIALAQRHLGKQSRIRRPAPSSTPVFETTNADIGRYEYLRRLARSKTLSVGEIDLVARKLQIIGRTFPSLTRAKYPEHLRLVRDIEHAIKRESRKLNTLYKAFPNVSIIGAYELELVDLQHVLNGPHSHSTKAATIVGLASQSQTARKLQRGEPLNETVWHARQRLIEEVRGYIANGEMPPSDRYPGVRYGILLHFHAVVDLHDTSRADFETWLKGKSRRGTSTRRHKGNWKLECQVMMQQLRSDKSLHESLTALTRYPFKGETSFNYEKSVVDRVRIPFNEQELALMVWLQHLIGHERLKIRHNVGDPGVQSVRGTVTRGRRAKPKTPVGSLPGQKAFEDQAVDIMRQKGRLDLWNAAFYKVNDPSQVCPVDIFSIGSS